jgi:hypothetical protein
LLTRRQYVNTLRDLFADPSLGPDPLPADVQDSTLGFAFHTTGIVAAADASLYRDAAETMAKTALGSVDKWLPCAATAAPADFETSCLATFLGPTGLAQRIFRRPLSAADVGRLTALYTTGRAPPLSLDFTGAIGLVIEATLQSPEFLYHWELDPVPAVREGSVVKLGNYEIANRLSYLLWGTMPDATLFAAAAAGALADLPSVEAQVRRMLKDERAKGAISDFFTDWLDIDQLPGRPKDSTVYPTYSGALAAAMATEVEAFVNQIVFAGTGRFDDLLTGTTTIVGPDLAALYGIAAGGANVPSIVSLNPAERSGLLTLAGFLSVTGAATGSDPPRRGKAIYERLLCGVIQPAPPAMPAVEPPSPTAGTTRQRFERQDTTACATACHSTIDPWGFALENYDGIGAYRSTDNGMAVDARVTVTLDGQQKMVSDARGLATALAQSDEARTCFVKQWFRYGLGRLDTARDQPSIAAGITAFESSMRDIRELVVALATSRTFRYRTPGTAEVLP